MMPPITPLKISELEPATRTAALDVLAVAALELVDDALPEGVELVAVAVVTAVV